MIVLLVYPVPGPLVNDCTRFAPTNRSFAFVVVTGPLLPVVLFPCAPMETSRVFTVSSPLYSAMRMSGKAAAGVNVTVTALAVAAAAVMFFA